MKQRERLEQGLFSVKYLLTLPPSVSVCHEFLEDLDMLSAKNGSFYAAWEHSWTKGLKHKAVGLNFLRS